MPAFDLNSLAKLPVKSGPDDFWIISVVRIAGWVEKPPKPPYRPSAAVVITRELGIHLGRIVETRDEAMALLLPSLLEFAGKVGSRPARIVTNQADTEANLRSALGKLIELKTEADLPPLDAVKQELMQIGGARESIPSLLEAPGVTPQDVRAFAKASADFFRAAPWRYLNDYDLIYINAPQIADGQKYVVVMGAGGQTFGLAFYQSRERYDLTMSGQATTPRSQGAAESVFSITYNEPFAISFAEHDLWEDEDLPLAAPNAYPFAGVYELSSELVQRPDAALLDHAQATLAALAATTEEEMDSGRWSKTVMTLDGPVQYTLAIPSLMKSEPKKRDPLKNPMSSRRAMERAMADIAAMVGKSGLNSPDEINRMINKHLASGEPVRRESNSPRERAEDLLELAEQARGRRQIQLAREALTIDPDNADALNLLAGRAGDALRRIELFQQAVEAGRRAIGDEFDSTIGHFWGVIATRPYMRARCGLAMALRAVGRHEETLDHLLEMLRLNPNDNQGIRDLVPASLLALGRNKEVLEHTSRYGRDTAIPAYASALAAFRLYGSSPDARKLLSNAIALNRHVPKFLSDKSRLPDDDIPGWSPGKPSEAMFCLMELAPAWEGTPGALQWIASAKPPAKSRKTRRR